MSKVAAACVVVYAKIPKVRVGERDSQGNKVVAAGYSQRLTDWTAGT